jgi:AcrR family transcriptional regulator
MGEKSIPARGKAGAGAEPQPRRRYDSAVRAQRATQTRERIVTEGAALARSQSAMAMDWKQLTFRAVAERARVSESTVYRHFANERRLHDAILQQLQDDAGVVYQGIVLDEVADVAGRVFAALSSFATPAGNPAGPDPTLSAADQERGQALRDALQAGAPHLTSGQREAAAGVLDVLWSPLSFERLSAQWRLSPQQATDAIGWVIGLVVRSVRDGTALRDE